MNIVYSMKMIKVSRKIIAEIAWTFFLMILMESVFANKFYTVNVLFDIFNNNNQFYALILRMIISLLTGVFPSNSCSAGFQTIWILVPYKDIHDRQRVCDYFRCTFTIIKMKVVISFVQISFLKYLYIFVLHLTIKKCIFINWMY